MPFDSGGIWSLTPGYLAVTGQLILPSNHNPPLEDIASNGLSAVLVRDGRAPMTGSLDMGAQRIINLANGISATDGVNLSQLTSLTTSRGYLFGLTLSNNALDAVNDIDISAGTAASSVASPFISMNLASALGKRLDAAWTVGGTPAATLGGLDTGAVANGTYHVYLIQRSDTGVVDACFSTSATAPTIGGSIPAAYDRWRRIGSILREAAANVLFTQVGDFFSRAFATDRTSTTATGVIAIALSVPTGIVVQPKINYLMQVNQNSDVLASIGNGFDTGSNMMQLSRLVSPTGAVPRDAANMPTGIFTNTSAQIYYSLTVGAGSATTASLLTYGWTDYRGRT